MKIVLAKKAGFCFGVKRAVDLVFKTARKYKDRQVFTLGPIIHNPQVLELLERQGVHILERPEQAPAGSIVVIRAHGVPLEVKKRLGQQGAIVIDATCPRVVKVQKIIQQFYKKHYQVVIVGEKEHPEVKGLVSYANNEAWVVTNLEEVEKLPQVEKVLVVAQTTQNERTFEEIAARLKQRYKEVKVFNTVCNATHNRQEEVRRLARQADVFVVVGGRISGNTRRLVQIAQGCGIKTYHIETEAELPEEIKNFQRIAVTAGASTPYWLIRRVIYRIEDIITQRKPFLWRFFYKFLKSSLSTNFWAALAGASLTILGMRLNKIPLDQAPVITFFYLWAMHLLNHLTDLKNTYITDPTRFGFYRRFFKIFVGIGIGCIAFSLALSATSPMALGCILLLTVLGLLYNVEIPFFKVKLKYLPGSKTIFVPLTWSFLGSFFPFFLKTGVHIPLKAVWSFFYLFGLAFIRTCTYDLVDIQGDQMLGKETLPIVLGERKNFKLLYLLILIFIGINTGCAFAQRRLGLFIPYNLVLAAFFLYLWQIEHKYLRPGLLSDILVDGFLILMGVWALI